MAVMTRKYNILMILSQEFMADHGSGIQVRNRLKAILKDHRYRVDLLTLPYGTPIHLEGLNIFRIPKVWRTSDTLSIGPSLKKAIYDMILFLGAFIMIGRREYHIVYTHEETGLIGALVKKLFRLPHIYEMHSFLPQGMRNYGVSDGKGAVHRCTTLMQKIILDNADHAIAIAPDIKAQSLALSSGVAVRVIENCFPEGEKNIDREILSKFRATHNPGSRPLVLYTGNKSEFQGVDILLKSIPYVQERVKDALFMLVGLSPAEVASCAAWASQNGLTHTLACLPRKPVEEIPYFLAMADCLVSPRKSGSNTPFKLYAYLASGKPIVATHILSHLTAVSDEDVFWVDPCPKAMAGGILTALTDKPLAEQKARSARQTYLQKYTWDAFVRRVQAVLRDTLEPSS